MSRKRVKRSSKKHLKDEEKVSKLRIFITLITILTIALVIIVLNNINREQDNSKQEIETALNDTFSGLKDSNVDKINQYLDYDLLISSFDPMIVENSSENSINIKKKMFQNIKWTVEDIEIKDNTSVAIVEVTNINFKTIVTSWMKEIVSISSTGVVITNDLALEKLLILLNQENLEYKTVIKKVKLVKENDKWYIELNDDFRDLVFSGIDSVVTVLNEN